MKRIRRRCIHPQRPAAAGQILRKGLIGRRRLGRSEMENIQDGKLPGPLKDRGADQGRDQFSGMIADHQEVCFQ